MRRNNLTRQRGRAGGQARARGLSPPRRSEIARRAAQARWERVRAAAGPAVLRRLHALLGDDERSPSKYGFIKAIVDGAPLDWVDASLILPSAIPDPVRDFFRRRSYDQILKRIEREERQAQSSTFWSAEEKDSFLFRLNVFQRRVYEALMNEPALRDQERQFRRCIMCVPTPPKNGEEEHVERGLVAVALHLQVWTCPKQNGEEARLLGEEVIPHEGDYSSKFKQAADRFAAKFGPAVDRLLSAHCQVDKLMRLHFRRLWWTKRRSPTGFPVVTGYLVPTLYDFLRPGYPIRARSGPGAYPQQLMRDIADILRLERRDLCSALTPSQVRTAVGRYLVRAKSDRPMGEAMFRAGSQYRWTGREAVRRSSLRLPGPR